ncbi:hypothetical protein [Candidatus Microthrix parvicella]|uniref:hypothetical protein n=1 Tax=Candidatus Neomicrothrix parvicella TaxID=41950 RepID=UPI00036F1B05|nr:hypothetical protein [Candidatus Microthrix parvicella]
MTFPSITNRGEFFSNHYLDAVIGGDLGDLRKAWDEAEGKGEPSARTTLKGAASRFFKTRATASEATGDRAPAAIEHLNDVVLHALGFEPNRNDLGLTRNTTDRLTIRTAATAETGTGLWLVALDAGLADSADDLFDDGPPNEGPAGYDRPAAGRLLEAGQRHGDKKQIVSAADAVGELFAVDEPPRFVLVLGGRIVLLAERAKWAEGRYLAVDLDAALERNDAKARGELETIAALFSADALLPGGTDGDGAQSALDELVDKSHKHAVGVSKALREGIRDSIEILANEVIAQRIATGRAVYNQQSGIDANELTSQCLRYLYRLLVLLYAESRPELGIVPANDEAYTEGYSLDRLRELCQVDLDTEASRNGTHLDESLTGLFELVNKGYHAETAEQQLFASERSLDEANAQPTNEFYLQFPGLDALLFDTRSTRYLDEVKLRNEALQQVLAKLMLATAKLKGDSAGYISYAQLGINQLGAVYEGLMAYTGFFATGDLFEVAKGGDPSGGTWMLPVEDADEYPDDVFVMAENPTTGRNERVRHNKGSFVFRLSGRDRQRSASYYTPEVLTRCVVHHALAELLGLDDYAPEGGSANIGEATELLDLTICEPALGSGAFLNEAINQLSAEYLKRRQAELGETLDPDRYLRELQKVKAHFALHQSYGVDLNATAVELAEVSLWLNAMHPGLKAPWLGLQLRSGNSLIGARRATWKVGQLKHRPWAETRKGHVQPPTDRPLTDRLATEGDTAEVHHFLLPGHGWGAVADRKEAKELRPDEAKALKAWRYTILKAPTVAHEKRLASLAGGVETLWEQAAERLRLIQEGLRRPIDVYGATIADRPARITRAQAVQALEDPDSALGRLRTLMDAWIGLWFWPLDNNAKPPTWDQWLRVAEDLVRPDERHGQTGQLDIFDDLPQLLAAEADRLEGQIPVAELRERNPWLAVACDAARREGAWHWDLEFAPAFAKGGFDLQVGNPPWVRPRWLDDVVLAEFDPWWGITGKAPNNVLRNRRVETLADPTAQHAYLEEVALATGGLELMRSPVERPSVAGIQTNLYMVFMDTTWRHSTPDGIVGLLHPEGHFVDPAGGALRRQTYGRLRRHWQFLNELMLFEDIGDTVSYGIHTYGCAKSVTFVQQSSLFHPDTADQSLGHSEGGMVPGIQYPTGGWDLRPHKSRVVTVDPNVLADWALLFDEPGTPTAEARLLRPVTTADLEALSVLARQSKRLADRDYHWTAGWHEKGAKNEGTIQWRTEIPENWGDVILQGPHFTVATPFAKQPNENCRSKGDYTEWDLENLPERVIPRTNYQRACDPTTYEAEQAHWDGQPAVGNWRVAWRRMTQPGLERSLQAALLPPGPTHVHTVHTLAMSTVARTATMAGFWASLPFDYLVKVSGKADIQDELVSRFPAPLDSPLASALRLRTLRLNCLTTDYAPLWELLYEPAWQEDRWTDPALTRSALGDIGPKWTMGTPLRRDQDRWQALVEIDALAALMLGMTADQLCAMYRTQFAVLRKYEYKMVFDAEGRKICGYHQSAGFRQNQLQDQAKSGDFPKEWKSIWNLYEQYEADPTSVDWQGHFSPPFAPANREAAMTRAYLTISGSDRAARSEPASDTSNDHRSQRA